MAKAGILSELLQELEWTVNRFEKEIGVKQSRIAKAIGNNSLIKDDLIEKISKRFPNINQNWLQTGKGAIFTDAQPPATTSTSVDTEVVPPGFKKPFPALTEQQRLFMQMRSQTYKQYEEDLKKRPLYEVLGDLDIRVMLLENK